MPPKLLVPTSYARVQDIEREVLSWPAIQINRLHAFLFATGDDSPRLITIPYRNETLSLHCWLFDSETVNYVLSRPGVQLTGIKREIFRKFPSLRTGLPLKNAYSVFYWTQHPDMVVNRALAITTPNAKPHLLLRGDVIVVKHQQTGKEKFSDMLPEDEALVCAILDDAVSHGMLESVVDVEH